MEDWREKLNRICDDLIDAVGIIKREKTDSLPIFDEYWDEIIKTLKDSEKNIREYTRL